MSRAVRNALMIAGLLALAWLLLVLAWRLAKWLFIAAVWVTALTVVGVILLTQVVTQRRAVGRCSVIYMLNLTPTRTGGWSPERPSQAIARSWRPSAPR